MVAYLLIRKIPKAIKIKPIALDGVKDSLKKRTPPIAITMIMRTSPAIICPVWVLGLATRAVYAAKPTPFTKPAMNGRFQEEGLPRGCRLRLKPRMAAAIKVPAATATVVSMGESCEYLTISGQLPNPSPARVRSKMGLLKKDIRCLLR